MISLYELGLSDILNYPLLAHREYTTTLADEPPGYGNDAGPNLVEGDILASEFVNRQEWNNATGCTWPWTSHGPPGELEARPSNRLGGAWGTRGNNVELQFSTNSSMPAGSSTSRLKR